MRGLQDFRFSATEAECRALARRFGYLEIQRLDAVANLRSAPGGAVQVTIEISAAIEQACVVTLDAVPEHVEDRGTTEYRPGLSESEADRLTIEMEDDIVYEPLPEGGIDLGELAAQQLAVAATPFPRSADASAALPQDAPLS